MFVVIVPSIAVTKRDVLFGINHISLAVYCVVFFSNLVFLFFLKSNPETVYTKHHVHNFRTRPGNGHNSTRY